MKLEGYHNTEISNVENIFRQGFIYKHSDEHWLGQGIYFFADFDTAIRNIDMLDHTQEMKTIAVEIEVDDLAYFDLDLAGNNNSFRRYCIEKTKEFEKQGQKLVVNEPNKKKAQLKYKCFFMDLFKKEKGYEVVSKTFSKENPPYAEIIEGIAYLGLPFLEKYICVSKNEYIMKKNLVEKELVV